MILRIPISLCKVIVIRGSHCRLLNKSSLSVKFQIAVNYKGTIDFLRIFPCALEPPTKFTAYRNSHIRLIVFEIKSRALRHSFRANSFSISIIVCNLYIRRQLIISNSLNTEIRIIHVTQITLLYSKSQFTIRLNDKLFCCNLCFIDEKLISIGALTIYNCNLLFTSIDIDFTTIIGNAKSDFVFSRNYRHFYLTCIDSILITMIFHP